MAKKTEIKESESGKSIEIKNTRDMMALIARVDKGDPAPDDVRALAKELTDKPQLCRSIGNVQNNIFSEVLKDSAGSNFVRDCIQRYVEEMKAELGYASSTFVEKMLIDEIIMRWLRLQSIEKYHKDVTSQNHTADQGLYVEKRLDMSQKRFLKSIDTLAKVRKMIAQTQAKGAEMFKNLMSND